MLCSGTPPASHRSPHACDEGAAPPLLDRLALVGGTRRHLLSRLPYTAAAIGWHTPRRPAVYGTGPAVACEEAVLGCAQQALNG